MKCWFQTDARRMARGYGGIRSSNLFCTEEDCTGEAGNGNSSATVLHQ